MRLELIIEKNDGELWGRIENKPDYYPTTVAATVPGVIRNMRSLIKDYLKHEGKNDKNWKKIDPATVDFDIRYDVQAFFQEFEELNASSIARKAGLNESLLRQYKTGDKHPSAEQAQKIETAIRSLAKRLDGASIYA